MCCGELANAIGVVDLEASADATGRMVTYSIEMGQCMLRNGMNGTSNKKQIDANLDKVVFEQLHAEDVNHC